jgi:hypothetical protein
MKILPAALLLCLCPLPAAAGEFDLLLQRLEARGAITAEDARLVREKAAAPRVKARGDFRLRYQYSDNGSLPYARSRGRFRLRGEAELRVSDRASVLAGAASGASPDPRSANQTFSDSAGKKNVYIDRACLRYDAGGPLLFAGRLKNPLWQAADMLWDGDVAIEGAALRFDPAARPGAAYFGTAGLAVLGESAANPSDPYLLFAQQGADYRAPGGAGLKAAASLYGFSGVKGGPALAHRPSAASGYLLSNTLDAGVYKYDYDAAALDLEAYMPLPAVTLLPLAAPADFAALFGGYIKALGHGGDAAAGWAAGAKIGNRDISRAGAWQLSADLRRLGRDAWPDIFPDSDFYGGSTGVTGAEMLLSAGLGGGVSGLLGYCDTRPIAGAGGRERALRADLNFRF